MGWALLVTATVLVAGVLAAVGNAVVLLGVCAVLAFAGLRRPADAPEVDALPMLGIAPVGPAANEVSLTILERSRTGSIDLRGAAAEVFGDLVGSVLVVLAALTIPATGWPEADPVASSLIAALFLPRAVLLLRDAGAFLLEVLDELCGCVGDHGGSDTPPSSPTGLAPRPRGRLEVH